MARPREHRPTFGFLSRPPDPRAPLDADFVQSRWTRLYRIGPYRAALMVALSLVLVLLTMAASLAPTAATSPLARLLTVLVVIPVLAAAFLAVARVLTSGVYVTDHAVRLATWRHATELPWGRIADVRRVPAPVALLGVLPRRQAEAVVVVLDDGTDLATPITTVSPEFLGRPEAYDIAALALERWWQDGRRTPPPTPA